MRLATIRFAAAVLTVALFALAALPVVAQDRPAYVWEMPATAVATCAGLAYKSGAIEVTFAEARLGPIIIKPDGAQGQPRVTGLEVLGAGKIRVQQGEEVLLEDDIHGAMFRFHPDDYAAFVTVTEPQHCPDAGVREMLLHLCAGSFPRFWHRGMQAFIPDQGIGAAFVYAKQQGGIMVWQNARELGAFCMTSQTELFKR